MGVLHLLNLLSRGVPPLFLQQFGDNRSIKPVLLHLCRDRFISSLSYSPHARPNASPLIQTYTKYLKQSDGLAAGDSGLFKLIHQLHHILHLFHRDGGEEDNRLAQVFIYPKLLILHILCHLDAPIPLYLSQRFLST